MNALDIFLQTASLKELVAVFIAFPGFVAISLLFTVQMLKEQER